MSYRTEHQVDLFRNFLTQGRLGVYAIIDDKVVGHAWATVSRRNVWRVNGYFRLSSGQALIHHCNVSPSFRRRGIYSAMVTDLCVALKKTQSGIRILVDTEKSNEASYNGLRKSGFELYGLGLFVQVGPLLLFRRQPKPPGQPSPIYRFRMDA